MKGQNKKTGLFKIINAEKTRKKDSEPPDRAGVNRLKI